MENTEVKNRAGMNVTEIVAELMTASAITAPKARGQNFIRTLVLRGEILKDIAAVMYSYGEKSGKKNFDRDSRSIAASDSLVLIGLKDANAVGVNCTACGFSTCNDLINSKRSDGEFKGVICALRILDMGIALGSAVKTASIHNIDNRISYRVGVVVREMGIVDWDFVIAIPLSVTGQNIFFDR